MPSKEPVVLLGLVTVVLVISGIAPYERATWWMEVAPVLIVVPLLAVTRVRFPLTPLAYRLLAVHAVILCVGGHWTYARVPLGDWARDAFGFARNHYDRLGHFTQGFVPALVIRELLRRRTPLPPGGWLFTLVTACCLAFSACYELVEWWAALLGGDAADAFLGTQGDVWDTQWDMALALAGAMLSQLLLARRHERELSAIRAAAARGAVA